MKFHEISRGEISETDFNTAIVAGVRDEKSVVHLDGCGDVRLTTLWYALTHALHTHTAHARDAGCDDTTVGAADGGLYYIFGSKFKT